MDEHLGDEYGRFAEFLERQARRDRALSRSPSPAALDPEREKRRRQLRLETHQLAAIMTELIDLMERRRDRLVQRLAALRRTQ